MNSYPHDPYDDAFDDAGREGKPDRERRPSLKRTGMRIKMQQIVAAPWSSEDMVSSYSIVGLGLDGRVYRYDARDAGWIPWSMEVLEPTEGEERRRR